MAATSVSEPTQQPAAAPARGSRAATGCFHCGEPLPSRPVLADDHAFCCHGCKTVYQLLAEHNLCRYYDLEQNPGQKQAETSTGLGYLDQPEVLDRFTEFSDGQKRRVSFTLPGVHCSSCIWLLEHLQRLNPAILHSEVHFLKKTLTVLYDEQALRLSELVRLLNRLGYPPDLNLNALEQEDAPGTQAVLNPLLKRLGVAGFCMGNLMLLAFPDYLAPGEVSEEFLRLFAWVSLGLGIPLYFYAGWDYLESAWKGLRSGSYTIDQPLALGMTALFVRSVWDVVSGSGMGFFDSLGGLVFFLLVGRYFQQRTYRFLSFERDYRSFLPLAVTRLRPAETPKSEEEGPLADGQDRGQDPGQDPGHDRDSGKAPPLLDELFQQAQADVWQEEPVAVTQLQVGDRIAVRSGEVVPADSLLLSNRTQVDYSFLTGEADPVTRSQGEHLYAGARVVGQRAQLLVEKPVRQSHLARLWNHPAFQKSGQRRFAPLIDRIARYFTVVVLTVATLSALFWLVVEPSRALNAFTAVLIIACPCALAFAAPFVFGHLTRLFGYAGFYLKNPDTLEALARVDTLVFDKTGTLTQPETTEVLWQGQEPLTAAEQTALLALARQSAHPLSQALVQELSRYSPEEQQLVLDEVEEQPGQGVRGAWAGGTVALGRADFVGGPANSNLLQAVGSQVHVAVNGLYKGCYLIRAHYREGLQPALAELGQRYPLHLLSGDSEREAARLQETFPVFTQQRYHQQPEQKLEALQALEQQGRAPAMLGDGLNDAGALKQAAVGIAVSDHHAQFTPAADGILHGPALHRLPTFLRVARSSLRIVWICFGISLIYNLTGTFFAVQGALSPVIAAILMPLNSIGIIAIATLLSLYVGRRAGLGSKT